MKKNILIVSASLLFLVQTNSSAQSNCGWQQGEMITYTQGGWDQGSGATLLAGNFSSVFGGGLTIGSLYTTMFSNASGVFAYLPASGSPATFSGNLADPLTTSAGELGGQVLALQLNVDLNDAGLLIGSQSTLFGDLVIHDFTPIPEVNGWTVRQFLATANTVVGGLTDVITPSTTFTVANLLNAAFLNGTPSQFAQEHLKKGWSVGDFETYTQVDWGQSNPATPLYNYFWDVYPGVFTIGTGYSVSLLTVPAVILLLPTIGPPGPLTGGLLNPQTSPAGELLGELIALKINIDYSDAGIFNDVAPLGELVFHDLIDDGPYPVSVLNGIRVRQFLADAEIVLGGGSPLIINSLPAIMSVLRSMNSAFPNGTPSQFAQEHLKRCCSKIEDAVMLTYTQDVWGDGSSDAGTLLSQNFSSLYGGGGLLIGGYYTLRFTDAGAAFVFLPASGPSGSLTGSLTDPITSSGGDLAGQVLALQFNVDLSDAGQIGGSFPFGDLIIHALAPIPAPNGRTVRQFLAIANEILGFGPALIDASQASALASALNSSFVDGTPSQFALDHLKIPCGAVPVNHCPTATAASAATSVGTAINIQLQAADADSDPLTFSISQNPTHGTVTTSSTGAAIYTPAAGYYGNDEFKFKANDGDCEAEGTISVTIVMCPKGTGHWKNNPNAWPASATPMMLGNVSYTKAQLINILNMSPGNGNGNGANASIKLAHKLITAKLSIANGSPAGSIASTITHADGLLAAYAGSLPYNVSMNSPAGQAMNADANMLENFNTGNMTTGCTVPVPQSVITLIINEVVAPAFDVKLFPNPAASYFTMNVIGNSNERITMQVIDMYGRVIETRNVTANSITRFGERYSAGSYFVRVQQGKEHKEIKLVKIN